MKKETSERIEALAKSFSEKFQSTIANVNGRSFGLTKGKGAFYGLAFANDLGNQKFKIRYLVSTSEAVGFKTQDRGYTTVSQGIIEMHPPLGVDDETAIWVMDEIPIHRDNLDMIMGCIRYNLSMPYSEKEWFGELVTINKQISYIIWEFLEKFNREIVEFKNKLSPEEEELLELAGDRPNGFKLPQKFIDNQQPVDSLINRGLVEMIEGGLLITQSGRQKLYALR